MSGLLTGRVVFVSGVGPGLGRETALAVAAHGADVALGGRTRSRLETIAAEVEALGRRAIPVECDITDTEHGEAAVSTIVSELGRLDVLVNNAFDSGDAKRFVDADLDDWRHTMDINLWGTLGLTQAAVPHLEASGDGRIVMINTMSTQRIRPRWGAYTASKSALAGVTKTLAAELGERGIRVNGIHPGYIYGPSVERFIEHRVERNGTDFQTEYDAIAAETSLGRIPTAEEIAGTVVYFASALSSPVTGQMIGVNGGHWFNG